MLISLDHIIVAVPDLDGAMQDYRDLGFTVRYGGRHSAGTTHNALICFRDGTYIELLALTGENSADGGLDFSPLAVHSEGLVGYALRTDNLEAEVTALREQGIAISEITSGGRTRMDGTRLEWKVARMGNSFTPFYIQDVTSRSLRVPDDPTTVTHVNNVISIDHLDMENSTVTLLVTSISTIVFDPAKTHRVTFVLKAQQ